MNANSKKTTKTKKVTAKSKVKTKKKIVPEQQSIRLQELNLEQITVQIIGNTPLLLDRMDLIMLQEYTDKREGKVPLPDTRTPEDKYEDKKHFTMEGAVAIPAKAFLNGMVEVAPYIDGMDKKKVKGSVRILSDADDLIPIEYSNEVKDKRWGRTSGISKAPHLIVRPKFLDWKCELTLKYNSSTVSAEQVCTLLNWAGFQMGVGGFRPEKSGNFGQYKVIA